MDAQELIAKYFSEGLTASEQQTLDTFLAADTVLQEDFTLQKELQASLRAQERQRKKQILQHLEQHRKSSTSKGISWRKLSIAASLLLLVGVGYFSGLFGSNLSEELFEQHYAVYPNTVYSVTRSTDELDVKRKAFTAYESQQYEEAIQLLETLKNTETAEPYDFYIGQSQLALGQTADAIGSFESVVDTNGEFTSEARWYLALSHLKNKENTKAKVLLNRIVEDQSYKYEAASVLLKALDWKEARTKQ